MAADQGSQDIVIRGTGVVLDVERLDITTEIPRIEVPDAIRSERDLVKRRSNYVDWINQRISSGVRPVISATSCTVEVEEWKVLTLMISAHQELSEGKIIPSQQNPVRELRVTLATWSGMPLADKRTHRAGGAHLKGVKVGLRPFNGRDAQDWERRGGTLNDYADYPDKFEVDLVEGRRLLDLYGWRLSAHKEDWFLYEVGGPLEAEVALWLDEVSRTQAKPELAERARIICPAAFGVASADDEPAARRRGR